MGVYQVPDNVERYKNPWVGEERKGVENGNFADGTFGQKIWKRRE